MGLRDAAKAIKAAAVNAAASDQIRRSGYDPADYASFDVPSGNDETPASSAPKKKDNNQ